MYADSTSFKLLKEPWVGAPIRNDCSLLSIPGTRAPSFVTGWPLAQKLLLSPGRLVALDPEAEMVTLRPWAGVRFLWGPCVFLEARDWKSDINMTQYLTTS